MEVTAQGFDNCVEQFHTKRDSIMAAYEKIGFDTKACNPVAMTIETCGFLYVFEHCPAGSWTASDHCNEWKEFAQTCAANTDAIIKLNDVSMDDLKEEVFV